MKIQSRLLNIIALCLSVYLMGCGGNNAAPTQLSPAPAPTISSLSPSSATAGGPQFTLTVNGANFASGAVVTWNGNSRATTFLSSTHLSATILATDIASSGSASVSVTNPGPSGLSSSALPFAINTSPVQVVISPKTVTMQAGSFQGQEFKAAVTGSTNTQVSWAVQEPNGGIINSFGVYFPPAIPGTFHVVATSQADNTKSDTATITVTVGLEISPQSLTLGFGQMQSFTATVTGAADKNVIWAVQEGAAGGSITSTGIYTAPQGQGSFHVVATSQADSRATATAVVTVVPIAVTIWPPADTLGPGGTRVFAALVTGNNAAVTWSVQEGAAGGSITSMGVYTAPLTLGNFHVVATSVADPAKNAIAPITVVQSGFVATGSMTTARQSHAATPLLDGRVLITGGGGGVTSDCGCGPVFASAEIFDPTTGIFTATGSMTAARENHTATQLRNGKVLIVGGSASAELYDPASGTFAPTGNMTTARSGHSATRLSDGRVLIAGGSNWPVGALATAEIFDPGSGSFTPTGSMNTARLDHTATLLSDGKVLIAGGMDSSAHVLATAELLDPTSGSFTATGSMAAARHLHTATLLLPGGKVLIAGGSNESDLLASAEVFDPASGTFTGTANMITARDSHTATQMLSGVVLITGGRWDAWGFPLTAAELFDQATGTFAATGGMTIPRLYHSATLLPDGRVLVTGGFVDDAAATATAEVYK